MPTISSRLAATCSDHEFIARFVCIGFSRRSWRAGLAAAIGEMEAPSLWIERCAPIDAGFEEGGLSVPSYLPADDSSLAGQHGTDRKSTRLNSSHSQISYAVFCLKKKKHSRRCIRSLYRYLV